MSLTGKLALVLVKNTAQENTISHDVELWTQFRCGFQGDNGRIRYNKFNVHCFIKLPKDRTGGLCKAVGQILVVFENRFPANFHDWMWL